MCNEDQERVFKMLAAILWLGNISFHVNDNENHIEVVNDEGRNHSLCIMFLNGLFAPYHVFKCLFIFCFGSCNQCCVADGLQFSRTNDSIIYSYNPSWQGYYHQNIDIAAGPFIT